MVHVPLTLRKISLSLTLAILLIAVVFGSGVLAQEGEESPPTSSNPELEVEEEAPPPEPMNVIRNGSFEARDSDPMNGVALEWEPYSNGRADYGWYDETWPEAVFEGEHAQLMEIFMVDGDILDRTIAVHQTVDVVPNASYELTIHALMRSQAPEPNRTGEEFKMDWGIDYSGQGNYDNVEMWNFMPLQEQYRLGSTGEFPENERLFYEVITGTVETGNSDRLTLFIRGVKKFPNGTEVNFDVDQVSLVGPFGAPSDPGDDNGTDVIITPDEAPENVPDTGFVIEGETPVGVVLLGALLIVVIGAGAAHYALMGRQEE